MSSDTSSLGIGAQFTVETSVCQILDETRTAKTPGGERLGKSVGVMTSRTLALRSLSRVSMIIAVTVAHPLSSGDIFSYCLRVYLRGIGTIRGGLTESHSHGKYALAFECVFCIIHYLDTPLQCTRAPATESLAAKI
ncbi:hypothetical protein TNCV_876241 [Trichonephila clavipes]|nr:hypothetical protein TNCV_876241 [Trichonephila clavipes]